MNTQSDDKLIDSVLTGDTEAFSALVTRYYRQVYGRLSARTGNPCDKQDITQEAFLIAWRKLAQLKDKRNFGAWICRIADNLAKTWYRRQCIQTQFEDAFEHVDQQKVHNNNNRKEDDLETLRSVAALCGTDRPDMPVLAGVLLEAHGRIVATDGRWCGN